MDFTLKKIKIDSHKLILASSRFCYLKFIVYKKKKNPLTRLKYFV